MGRLLDRPSPREDPKAAELRSNPGVWSSKDQPWPDPACGVGGAGRAGSINAHSMRTSSRPGCVAAVAVLVVGEFREFLPPFKPRDARWKDLAPSSVWKRLHEAVVVPNGPGDLFIHSWDSRLVHELVATLAVPPCSAVCERYDDEYLRRILVQHPRSFRLLNGFLRLNNSRETPHIVDFFYKRYAALRTVEQYERDVRRQQYRALLLTRPDVVYMSRTVVVPQTLAPRTIYLQNSDHHHDSTDIDTTADPMDRGLCGQMPNDWFAYGDRDSMREYLGAFLSLSSIHAHMRVTPGSCDWWRCHNYRYNHTFLNNAEAYLGFHLRRTHLKCHDVSRTGSHPVRISLPPTRNRDWGPGWETPPGRGSVRRRTPV